MRERRDRLDRVAGRLALVGAGLGVIVGMVDVAVGSSIRDWVGNKLETSTLGAGTILLSLIALTAAVAWQRPGGNRGGRRLATVLGLAIPAGICFTTIGRLWYVSGALILGAVGVILATSTRDELAGAVSQQRWLRGLTVMLGGYYAFLGFDALKVAGALGIAGGLLIWAAVATTGSPRHARVALIVLGALPFAIVTWWSVVTPLTAALVLVIGAAAVRPDARAATIAPTASGV
jgi:hypothetical protein